MLRLRLQRKGRKKRPIWHLVVAESRSPRDGRIIELVGRFDNVTEKKEVYLNEERIFYWLDKGAQPSDSVRKILRREGLLYKRHLIGWGKSQEEIDAALAEWNAYRQSKNETDTSRKEQYKSILAAEDQEYKKQIQEKSKQAAAELEAEKAAEETAEQGDTSATAEEEATAENEAAKAVESQTEEETVQAKDAEEIPAETAAAESDAEPVAAETESTEAEAAPAEEAEAPEATEAEAQAEEPAAEEEATATEAEAKETGKVSTDMTAKEAIDYINENSLADLEGFVTDAEDRVTVQRAWETKQQEG